MFFLSFFGDFLANLDDEPLETHNLLEQCPEAPRLNTIKSMMENVPTGGPRGECFSFVVRFVSLSLVSFCLFFPSFFFLSFSGEFLIDLDDDPLGVLKMSWNNSPRYV